MSFYVRYDKNTGEFKGFFDGNSDYSNSYENTDNNGIPTPNIKITDSKREEMMNNTPRFYQVNLRTKEIEYVGNPITLERKKQLKLDLVRSNAGSLIDNRYKPFDRENLFILENKSDIKDYRTGERHGKQQVKDNINAMREACNELEGQIEKAQTKEELAQLDLSEDNLRTKATDRPEENITGNWIID